MLLASKVALSPNLPPLWLAQETVLKSHRNLRTATSFAF